MPSPKRSESDPGRSDFQLKTKVDPYPEPPPPLDSSDAIWRGFLTGHASLVAGQAALATAMERYLGARPARQRMLALGRLADAELVRYFAQFERQQASSMAGIADACADHADDLARHAPEVEAGWLDVRDRARALTPGEAEPLQAALRDRLRARWASGEGVQKPPAMDPARERELDHAVGAAISRVTIPAELPDRLLPAAWADGMRATAVQLRGVSTSAGRIVAALDQSLLEPSASQSPEGDLAGDAGAGGGIRLRTAYWVVPGRPGRGRWAVAGPGEPAEPAFTALEAETVRLPPGEYRVYWFQDSEGRPMLLARSVQVLSGELADVPADAGIQLHVAGGLPLYDPHYGWWGVVPAGQQPSPVWQSTASWDALVLPPGTYDVYWRQDYEHEPMLWQAGVRVRPGELTRLTVDTALALDVATSPPVELGPQGWWAAVPTGGPPHARVNWSATPGVIVLPAGRYDVYWRQDYEHEPMLWQAGVPVRPGELTRLTVDTALALDVATSPPVELGPQGWWAAVPTGGPPNAM